MSRRISTQDGRISFKPSLLLRLSALLGTCCRKDDLEIAASLMQCSTAHDRRLVGGSMGQRADAAYGVCAWNLKGRRPEVDVVPDLRHHLGLGTGLNHR